MKRFAEDTVCFYVGVLQVENACIYRNVHSVVTEGLETLEHFQW